MSAGARDAAQLAMVLDTIADGFRQAVRDVGDAFGVKTSGGERVVWHVDHDGFGHLTASVDLCLDVDEEDE